MVIRLMTDDISSTSVCGYLKDQIHAFIRELCVITSDKVVMVEPLLIRINNRTKYGYDKPISNLKLFADILRSSILPNVDSDGNRFRFDICHTGDERELNLTVTLV